MVGDANDVPDQVLWLRLVVYRRLGHAPRKDRDSDKDVASNALRDVERLHHHGREDLSLGLSKRGARLVDL